MIKKTINQFLETFATTLGFFLGGIFLLAIFSPLIIMLACAVTGDWECNHFR